MASTILVRAKLTEAEWVAIRKLALDKRLPVSQLAGDALRALLKKGS